MLPAIKLLKIDVWFACPHVACFMRCSTRHQSGRAARPRLPVLLQQAVERHQVLTAGPRSRLQAHRQHAGTTLPQAAPYSMQVSHPPPSQAAPGSMQVPPSLRPPPAACRYHPPQAAPDSMQVPPPHRPPPVACRYHPPQAAPESMQVPPPSGRPRQHAGTTPPPPPLRPPQTACRYHPPQAAPDSLQVPPPLRLPQTACRYHPLSDHPRQHAGTTLPQATPYSMQVSHPPLRLSPAACRYHPPSGHPIQHAGTTTNKMVNGQNVSITTPRPPLFYDIICMYNNAWRPRVFPVDRARRCDGRLGVESAHRGRTVMWPRFPRLRLLGRYDGLLQLLAVRAVWHLSGRRCQRSLSRSKQFVILAIVIFTLQLFFRLSSWNGNEKMWK